MSKCLDIKIIIALIIIIISFLLTITFFSIIEYIKSKIYNKKNFFWTFSKIDTIKNILRHNKYNYPILNFTQDLKEIFLYKKYEKLLNDSTKDICEDGFKKCGILDTYGNIMCLEYNLSCPINEIIIDSKEKEKEYINKGFYSLKLNETYYLYYTNNSIDKDIIIELKYSEEQPKLITEDNLIIDDYIFRKINGNISFYNYSKSTEYKEYNSNQINHKNNIDISYKKIFENYYIKRNIGFENYEEMDNFINYNYYLFDNYNYYKKFEIANIILFIFNILVSSLYLILYSISVKPNAFIISFDFLIFEIYILFLINIYKDIDDNVEFLMKYEDLLNNFFFKELSLFIFSRKLIIISFHIFTFSFTLKIIFIFNSCNK